VPGLPYVQLTSLSPAHCREDLGFGRCPRSLRCCILLLKGVSFFPPYLCSVSLSKLRAPGCQFVGAFPSTSPFLLLPRHVFSGQRYLGVDGPGALAPCWTSFQDFLGFRETHIQYCRDDGGDAMHWVREHSHPNNKPSSWSPSL